MRKLLCWFVVVALLCAGLCGCGNKDKERRERIEAHLNAGEYEEAYDVAETSDEKKAIAAENVIAAACYNLAVNVDVDLTLVSGAYGQAKASAADEYTPNDDVFAIENYEKLAEYISLLSGADVLEDYYYSVYSIKVEGYTTYCLDRINIDSGKIVNIYAWDTLDQTAEDDNTVSLCKYIARYIMENGTQLSISAVDRINEKYMSDTPEKVKLEVDLG